VAQGGLGLSCAAPPTLAPHYIGGQGAVLADLGLVESPWDSYSQRESFPLGSLSPRRTPPHLWRPHHQISASPLGVPCPPRLRVVGRIWYCPETSGTFQDLPGPFGTILGHSETFRDGFGTFRNLLEHFQDLPGPFSDVLDRFWDDPGYSLIYPMTAKVVGTPSDYPETIPVDPGLPQYHSHMFRNHLGLFQSDSDISLNTQNYFWCPYEQFHKYPELLPVPV
jgi:hypothetical protein